MPFRFKNPQTPATVKNTATAIATNLGLTFTAAAVCATTLCLHAPVLAAAVVGVIAGPIVLLGSPTNPFNPKDMFHKFGDAVSFLQDAFRDKDKKAIALVAACSLVGAFAMASASNHINAAPSSSHSATPTAKSPAPQPAARP